MRSMRILNLRLLENNDMQMIVVYSAVIET